MTWAERVGDLATRITMVILLTLRIFTELLRLAFVTLDRFVMDLGRRSEAGLDHMETSGRGWVRLPGAVLLGVAYVILEFFAIFTVFFRQAATVVNDFVVGLAEGEDRIGGTSSSVTTPRPQA